MPEFLRSALVLAAIGLAAACGAQGADDAPAAAEDKKGDEQREKERAARMERMGRIAAEYEMFSVGDREQKLERVKDPILRWSNPLRNTDDGALFLWTDGGRPAAVLCIYTYGDRGLDHEFQSLSGGPLRGEHRQTTLWQPESAGIALQPIPGTPDAPASTPARRLSQMRKLLRDFSAGVGRTERHELRLLTNPVYRYGDADEEGDVLDGAIFAFVQGTDPEMLLVIEARRKPGQAAAWHYAPARMSMVDLELQHNDVSVWTVPFWNQRSPRGPYITFHHQRDW